MTIVDLLSPHAEVVVTRRREDPELAAVAIAFANDRRMILLERTYRGGVAVIVEPTDDELTALQTAGLWTIWNSSRTVRLAGIGVTGTRLSE